MRTDGQTDRQTKIQLENVHYYLTTEGPAPADPPVQR